MRPNRHLLAACAALSLGAASPAVASAEAVPPVAPAPTEVPAPPAPAAGSMKIALVRVGGSPPFALIGARIAVRGSVSPYVAGQTVKVSIYRQGRKVAVKILSVLPAAGGAGTFSLNFASAHAGEVDIRAAHYANAQQGAFSARAPIVRVGTVGAPAAVRAQRAPLRGTPERRPRRSDRPRPDRLPQGHGPRPHPLCGPAGLPAALPSRRCLPDRK